MGVSTLTIGLLLQTAAAAGLADGPALSLDQAVARALKNQPQIQQAQASTDAARARADQAFSGLMPQVTGVGTYSRSTSNFAPSPGSVPSQLQSSRSANFKTSDYFNFGLTGSILVYDFGQTRGRWHAAEANVDSQEASLYATRTQIVLSVRTAYFQARAQKALLDVAQQTLSNQDKHLQQIEGFVQAGSRPEIDLAQAKSDRASAELQVINAQNAFDTARAQLSQAIGEDEPVFYDVADDTLAPVSGEDGPVAVLADTAYANRPDLRALRRQEDAQRITVSATKAAYAPSLGVSTGLTEAGPQLDSLVWNWNVKATLTWQIYQGGLVPAQVREAEANLSGTLAQERLLRQQIRFDVEQAFLAAKAAKAAETSAEVAAANARERYRLAEGRYQSGVGSIIELGDAQVALSNALAQSVQADYGLATARAQLLRALGQ